MERARDLPSVDEVLRRIPHLRSLPQSFLVGEIRAVLGDKRAALRNHGAADDISIEDAVEERVNALLTPSLRRVINATGVILHTNLGRAPLVDFKAIGGYSNLEYDLESGQRGKRDVHTAGLLRRLLGRDAIVVNNNAAAAYLVLHELAAGGDVIVSRGELIEIGDGFRVPEIMARSGALLREVGTTNRTRAEDYENAIDEKTRLIMCVHRSNFRITGFTSTPDLASVSSVGKRRGIPVYQDLGSGCFFDLRPQGISEPTVMAMLGAGVNVVSFSCDKLLGGPQSGIIAGDGELITRIRRNPMYRAFRVDKLVIQTLEETLRHVLKQEWNAIPTLRMITTGLDELQTRAERVAHRVKGRAVQAVSVIGGGSTPEQALPTWAVELEPRSASQFEQALRRGAPPVIARIERERVILDMRTVAEDDEESLIAAVIAIND